MLVLSFYLLLILLAVLNVKLHTTLPLCICCVWRCALVVCYTLAIGVSRSESVLCDHAVAPSLRLPVPSALITQTVLLQSSPNLACKSISTSLRAFCKKICNTSTPLPPRGGCHFAGCRRVSDKFCNSKTIKNFEILRVHPVFRRSRSIILYRGSNFVRPPPPPPFWVHTWPPWGQLFHFWSDLDEIQYKCS